MTAENSPVLEKLAEILHVIGDSLAPKESDAGKVTRRRSGKESKGEKSLRLVSDRLKKAVDRGE